MATALKIDKKLKNIINHNCQGCDLYRISRTINQLADNKGPFWLWVVIYMTHPRVHRFGPPPLLCQRVTKICLTGTLSTLMQVSSHPLNPVAWPMTSNTWKKPNSL